MQRKSVLRLRCAILVIWIGISVATKIGAIHGDGAAGGAESAVRTLRAQGLLKVRLDDADSAMLRALRRTSIQVIVGLRNDELLDIGGSEASARRWILQNVEAYFPETRITAIAVGNEILTSKDESLAPFLVPAMRNLHAALSAVGLEKHIKISTPQSLKVLSPFSSPSSAAFDRALVNHLLSPVLDFLDSTGSFFMLNLHPLDIPRSGDLSSGNRVPSFVFDIHDPVTGLHYSNKLEVLVDAVFVALASFEHPKLDVVVSEASWSKGSPNEDAAAVAFLVDLTKHVTSANGTPLKPEIGAIDMYVQGQLLSSLELPASESGIEFVPSSGFEIQAGVKRKLLQQKTWCVAKADASTEDLQAALDWACGPGGAECRPIQVGQFCFLPNTMQAHASYAFNSYYQKVSWAAGSCDFGGIAQTTSTDPSYTGCLYQATGTDPLNSTGSYSFALPLGHHLSMKWLIVFVFVSWFMIL